MYGSTNPIASRPLGETKVIINGVMWYKCNNYGVMDILLGIVDYKLINLDLDMETML